MEHSALQAGAAKPYRLTPEIVAESLESNPVARERLARLAVCWLTSASLSVGTGRGFEPRVTALETLASPSATLA